jgi:hypothetical protein
MNSPIKDDNEHVQMLAKSIANRLWPFDGIDLNADPIGDRFRSNSENRRAFKVLWKETIEELVKAGKTDEEIIEKMMAIRKLTMKTLSGKEWQSSIPEPLKPGETRALVEPADVRKAFMQALQDIRAGRDVVVGLCPDGRFVITSGEAKPLPKVLPSLLGIVYEDDALWFELKKLSQQYPALWKVATNAYNAGVRDEATMFEKLKRFGQLGVTDDVLYKIASIVDWKEEG